MVFLSLTLLSHKGIEYLPINWLAVSNIFAILICVVVAISNVYNFNRYREDFVFKAQLCFNAFWALIVSFDLPSWLVWAVFLTNVLIIVINRFLSE